jgi:YegS/Rv2252/BmrU family lipid kinase
MKYFICGSEETINNHDDFLSTLSKDHAVTALSPRENIHNGASIIVLGGDGTLNYMVNNFNDLDQGKIIYFPTGTANDFAKSMGIIERLPSTAIVDSINKNAPTIKIPVMKCNDRYFINVATAGSPARVTSTGGDLLKETIGRFQYYIAALEKLLGPEEYKLSYQIDNGEKKSLTTHGFLVSQGLFAGGGVKVSSNFTPNFKEYFNFISPNSTDLTPAIQNLINLQKTDGPVEVDMDSNQNDLIDFQCQKLKVTAYQEIPVKLDGEEYCAREFCFEKSSTSLEFYLY